MMQPLRHVSIGSTNVLPIEFVKTSVSERILNLVNLACASGDNAAILGVAGCGKSFALRHYFDGNGDDACRMFTVDSSVGHNSTYLIEQLCDSYGVQAGKSRAESLRRFISHAQDYFYGDRQVIVFDEAQNLKIDFFKDLANLSCDHALNITVVFCGNPNLLKTTNSSKADFLQRDRRVKQRTLINMIEDADADALAKAFGVEDAEVCRMARAIGAHFYIDGVVTILQAARRCADGKPIRAQHAREALDLFPQYRSAIAAKVVRTAVA